MREHVVKRMEAELKQYRMYLVSGQLTAEQMLEEAYQLVVKQGIFYIFNGIAYGSASEDEWNWLNEQTEILNYLYMLWLGNDMDFTEEFYDLLRLELRKDMEAA